MVVQCVALPKDQGLVSWLLRALIPSIWHRNRLGETQMLMFNKNTWYFSVLCTPWMSEHSGHYCTVMYKCKVSVFMTILCTRSPMPHSSWVTTPRPLGNWLWAELLVPAAPFCCKPREMQVELAVSPLLEQNQMPFASSFPKNKQYL